MGVMMSELQFLPRLTSALVLVTATALGLIGCKPAAESNSADPKPRPSTNRLRYAAPAGEPIVMNPLPGRASGIAGATNDADQAWIELAEAMQMPDPPEAWLLQEPSKEEIESFKQTTAKRILDSAKLARSFYTKYAQHEHAADARQQEYNLLSLAAQLGNTNALPALQKLEAERLKDPDLSEDDRLELRLQQVQRTLLGSERQERERLLPEFDKNARALQKEFPKRAEVHGLLLVVAEGWLEEGRPEKAIALANDVVAAADDEELRDEAGSLLKKAERLGKPLQLKFTALDGRAVDLQQLKGKVVLVDFWATWCQPCVRELPNVKAAYAKLREKGFEIIGISLDQDKTALERLVARENITWPQCFDASPESNRFAESFGIATIPTMWLVDKKGILRHLNARDKLTEKVEQLLAE